MSQDNRVVQVLDLLFGLRQRVDRPRYAVAGFSLMALKLGVDMLILFQATARLWMPWEYLSLLRLSESVPTLTTQILMLWALPFAWIGLSMTVRRSVDAGLSPWFGLLYCIPFLNFAVMLVLCLVPTRERRGGEEEEREKAEASYPVLRAVALAILVAMVMAGIGILGLETLGAVLFAGTPLGMGVVAGFTFNRPEERTAVATGVVALAALMTAFGLLLLFAVEGLVCLTMALPVAIPFVVAGALLGRGVARMSARRSPVAMVLLLLPATAVVEPHVVEPRLLAVTSSVEIAAAPDVVWDQLIAFKPLDPPTETLFKLGIAYPTEARIEGTGVGAVRYCVFSTGAFIEPITVWDEPRHLAFDVREQPEPLREMSPYKDLHLDHLDGTIYSRRGEFRLRPTADGGTVLEGTTWYELGLLPEPYWQLWSDAIIRTIHLRVLRHVRDQAEAG